MNFYLQEIGKQWRVLSIGDILYFRKIILFKVWFRVKLEVGRFLEVRVVEIEELEVFMRLNGQVLVIDEMWKVRMRSILNEFQVLDVKIVQVVVLLIMIEIKEEELILEVCVEGRVLGERNLRYYWDFYVELFREQIYFLFGVQERFRLVILIGEF